MKIIVFLSVVFSVFLIPNPPGKDYPKEYFLPVESSLSGGDLRPLVQVGSPVKINFPPKPGNRNVKMRIVANNTGWQSLDRKLNELRNWFYSQSDGRLILDYEVVRTSFKSIPYSPVKIGDAGDGQTYQAVDPVWYDENISSRAKKFDMVLFLVPVSEWPKQAVAGWRTDRNQGPIEIQLRADESERSYSQGYPMSAFVDFSRHEIAHGLFLLTGQADPTHQFYYSGKFDSVLKELDYDTLRSSGSARLR